MTLEEWCKCAWQNQLGFSTLGPQAIESHIYSNYRYSRQENLITDECARRFEFELTNLIFRDPESANGAAANIVDIAGRGQHRNGVIQKSEDFRLMGPVIQVDDSVVFARLDFVSLSRTSSTSEGYSPQDNLYARQAPGRDVIENLKAVPDPRVKIKWLAVLSNLLGELDKSIRSRDALITLIFRKLGLKPDPASTRERRRLCLYRMRPGETLHRPHAWSEGFASRFSAYSPRTDGFGSTVDVDSGSPCLPEAVTREADLEKIEPTGPIYEGVCGVLQSIDPSLVAARASDAQYISGDIVAADAQPRDGYSVLKAIILAQLGTSRVCDPKSGDCCCAAMALAGIGNI